MAWNDIKNIIKNSGERDLLAIIQDLYSLNPTNKSYLTSRFLVGQRVEVIEEIKTKISKYTEKHHKQRECRTLINNYKKSTCDLLGFIQLCAHHAYAVAKFEADYGGFDDNFGYSGITSFEHGVKAYHQLPDFSKSEAKNYLYSALEKANYNGAWLYDSYKDHFDEIKN